MQDFIVQGPLGNIECVVEANRSESNAVLIMSHGFRGSRESGGYAKGYAEKAAAWCDVVRYNFTGTTKLSTQISELSAVVAEVRRLKPEGKIFLLGRSMGSATTMLYTHKDKGIEGVVLWSAPNDLGEALVHVMSEECYEKLLKGETLHISDERGETDITPDFLTDYYELRLPEVYKHWDGRPILLLHCEGDEQVPVHQARENVVALGECCEGHIWPNGSHSIAEYSEEAGNILAKWLERLIYKEEKL